MGAHKLPYGLILLVVSSFCDDLWACCTPDPDDHALAAENNEYLASARPPGRGHRGEGEGARRTTALPGAAHSRPAAPLWHLRRGTHPPMSFDRDPLFWFMSLQR